MDYFIKARYVFDGMQLLENRILSLNNQVVDNIYSANEGFGNSKVLDLGEMAIMPGMIDLQLNGCGGVLLNSDISEKALEIMYSTCLKYGTTKFLPTLITSDTDSIFRALELIDKWVDNYGYDRGVLGLHLEGPFISHEKHGIHNEKYIQLPNDELLFQISRYAKRFNLKMTIAPEVFHVEQLNFLQRMGVILSAGHSNASYAIAKSGFDNGIKTATHAFNAMSGLSGRIPGVVGAIMNSDCYVGVIADLLHVDESNIELLHKIKKDRLYIVTDAVTPMGTNLTEFDFVGKKIFVKDGRCVDENGTLGGANITMNQSVRNLVEGCNISLEDALKMAITVPAKLLEQYDKLANICEMPIGNLVCMDLNNYSCRLLNESLIEGVCCDE